MRPFGGWEVEFAAKARYELRCRMPAMPMAGRATLDVGATTSTSLRRRRYEVRFSNVELPSGLTSIYASLSDGKRIWGPHYADVRKL
jgi:hypothetical protein